MELLTPFFVLRGGFLSIVIVPGEGFCSLQVVSRGFVPTGVVMEEIDTCISISNLVMWQKKEVEK